ncbi:non-specific lipid-transfer protein P5-like [Hibiscus syriacus]|uniref:non-specific lipid-transfer protein P5-like n=1 Tax=Hibiscus syriacus TaxID=106335 RepID=UPI001923FC4A|nr:non-specific lipid-transfer protein P5-like [Hibiscus syriacus]
MENILMGSFGAILGLLAVVLAAHAMTCEEAIATLMPCKPYLTTSEPSPTLACCQAVATVNASASTTQSRRDLCECFRKNAPAYGVIADKAKKLPGLCAVHVPVPIYPSVNCHNIH